jgi:hypothetical protein
LILQSLSERFKQVEQIELRAKLLERLPKQGVPGLPQLLERGDFILRKVRVVESKQFVFKQTHQVSQQLR